MRALGFLARFEGCNGDMKTPGKKAVNKVRSVFYAKVVNDLYYINHALQSVLRCGFSGKTGKNG